MARIRTIKPEFPQSESMGRVSRDARLLFVMLWTICDDAGRARANSRMLASLLFPYDDVKDSVAGWLDELERERCVTIYEVEGNTYLQVEKWLSHQRIDKPTASKFPAPPDVSREVARPREASTLEGKGREGKGEDREGTMARSADADDLPAALEVFNEVAREFGWPEAQRITDARKSKFRQRLRECGGSEGWRAAMAKARASPFLNGTGKRAKGHESWAPDLDFFLQQSSFTKLMEGKYDDRSGNHEPTGFDAVIAGARAAIAGGAPAHPHGERPDEGEVSRAPRISGPGSGPAPNARADA